MSKSLSTTCQINSSIHSSLKRKELMHRTASSLPPTQDWPNPPIFLCTNILPQQKLHVDKYQTGPCPLSKPFTFESDLFEGTALIRLRDVPSQNSATDEKYFNGRTRRFLTRIQGRFKVGNIPISDVMTGHEFSSPFKRLPPSWIIRAGTSLISTIAPGADIDITSNNPKILSSLAGTSQIVRVDEVGMKPNIETELDIKEDCSLLGNEFQNSISIRKKLLSDPKTASQYTFDPKYIYTFDFYQNALDFSSYSLNLGFTSVGLSKSLNGQPIQCMAKSMSLGKYLWCFQIWHENLLLDSTSS